MPILFLFLFLSMEGVTHAREKMHIHHHPPEWKRVWFSQEVASDRCIDRPRVTSCQCMNHNSRRFAMEWKKRDKGGRARVPNEVDDKGENKPHIINQIKRPYPERSFGPLPALYKARSIPIPSPSPGTGTGTGPGRANATRVPSLRLRVGPHLTNG